MVSLATVVATSVLSGLILLACFALFLQSGQQTAGSFTPSPEASLRSGAAQQAYPSNSNLPPRFQELLDANAQMKNRLEQHEKGLLTREASLQTREANLPTREARFEQREKGLLTREASLQTREDKLQTQGGSRQKDEESLNQRPTAAGTGLHSKYV